MEVERARAPSLPDTHGRIGGGRGEGWKKKRKTQEVALHQYLSLKKRVRATVQNLAEYHLEIANDSAGKFQTNLKVHKRVSECMSCESFEWGKR